MSGRINFLSLVFALLFILPVNAQKINEDSLRKVIDSSVLDTVRVDAMLTLANYLLRHKQDEKAGLPLLNEAFSLASNAKLPNHLARYYLIYSNYLYMQNDWAGSIENLKKMQEVAKEIPDAAQREDAIMKSTNNLAGIHYFNGDFIGALEYHLKALEQVEQLPHNADSKATLYVNIASDYRLLNLYGKSYEYVSKITPMLSEMSDVLKVPYFYELFQSQINTGRGEEAFQTLQVIKNGFDTFDLNEGQMQDLRIQFHEQSGIYEMVITKNYQEALRQFELWNKASQEANADYSIVESSFNLGTALDSLHQYERAIPVLRQAYNQAIEFELAEFALKSAKLLAKIYSRVNQDSEGLKFATRAIHLNDSIISSEKLKELNFLEAKYQAKMKEEQIAKLNLLNAEKELEVVKRNRMILAISIGGSLGLILLGLFYRNAKQKQIIAEKDQKIQEDQIKFLERQQQVISLQSMINGQETERTRIAKDLHDGLGGLFSTIKMHFSTLQHEQPNLKTEPLFSKSYDMVNTASEEVRRIAHNMMPEVLIKMGLVQATRELCNSISAGKLLQVSLQPYGMEQRLSPSTEVMLFRILQELLNNIIKHSEATEAIIQFNREGNRLSVTVEDNGRGFSLAESDTKPHAGLSSVESRVNYLNGKISIDSQKEVGTTVMMDFLINE
ncbi:tetratricopeptide repeat protein [Algoriphagus boseongensis]|uniref:Tetratricopeptide repeat protein n=1 Tax=Algoriphagus boseongensis TaxID=1442587 RepID=A0A4R6T9J7_9BACT|nr:sensor histidine kinase [Algoriphagus boseongensis]TDQ18215.1 tetratricopeptide repeat protein [Algoriphagus boseongensis]